MRHSLLTALLAVVIVPLFASVPAAHAQIRYIDINPDTVLSAPAVPGTYADCFIDINGDGKIDFQISHMYGAPDYISAEAYSYYDPSVQNYPCEIAVNGEGCGLAAPSQAIIGPSVPGYWQSSIMGTTSYPFYLSNIHEPDWPWTNAVDKYLGVRIQINGSYYYGWIRMDVAANTASITIKDYALNLAPDESIVAGDRGTSPVEEPPAPDAGVEIYALGETVVVECAQRASSSQSVTLYSLLGKYITERSITSERTSVSLSGAAAGCYIAVVQDGAKRTVRLVRVW